MSRMQRIPLTASNNPKDTTTANTRGKRRRMECSPNTKELDKFKEINVADAKDVEN